MLIYKFVFIEICNVNTLFLYVDSNERIPLVISYRVVAEFILSPNLAYRMDKVPTVSVDAR